MKIFVYKTLFVSLLIFIIFHATIGYVIKTYESKIQNTLNTDKLIHIKDKLRSEIKKGLKKDRILNKDDSIIINNFIQKITKELNDTK
jgi:hypothetical protein